MAQDESIKKQAEAYADRTYAQAYDEAAKDALAKDFMTAFTGIQPITLRDFSFAMVAPLPLMAWLSHLSRTASVGICSPI